MKHASLVLVTRDNHVLLGRRKTGSFGVGVLNAPGGKLEEGESMRACAVRELREETGLRVSEDALERVALITFYAAGVPDFVGHVYRVAAFRGEPVETESLIPVWYAIDDLPYAHMLESDTHWFLIALRGDPFAASVYYQERAKGYLRMEMKPLPMEDIE